LTMHTLIDDRALRDDPFINGLFLSEKKTTRPDDKADCSTSIGVLPPVVRDMGSGGELHHVFESDPVAPLTDDLAFARVIREIDTQAKRREFVWIGYLAKEAIPTLLGLAETESHSLLQRMVDAGVISVSKRPNPKNPDFPATGVVLNREHPMVKRVLVNGEREAFFEPVPIRGEPASATLIRERG